MKTLYLRNVPEDVSERLERLAALEGMSVSAFAVRELAQASRRADNARVLFELPDLGIEITEIVDDLHSGRDER